MPTHVPDHYGATNIVGRILAAIPWSRTDGTTLAPRQLFPFDQLHGRELLATQDHAALLNPAKGTHLLDIGSGIGGPARYIASTFGCRITGIDLTPDFVDAANELTSLCHLADRADFNLADAAKMPFKADTFDHAYCFYVGMNLADKPAVLGECFRVLKPGATLLWTQVTSSSGTPHYPLPWSRTAEGSHIQTREGLVGLISTAGFDVVSVTDETAAHLELAQRMKRDVKTPTAGQRQANEVVLGADFLERRLNYIKSLSDGCIASTLIAARKPERTQAP